MLKNYTISSLSSLKQLPALDTVQVTLNSRTFPSKRECAKNLDSLREYSDNDIIIHYDYIYIISRYCFFKQEVKDAVINEIHNIIKYSETDDRVKGIVMHTDWPIKKLVYLSDSLLARIEDNYNSSLWDTERIKELLSNNPMEEILNISLKMFYNDYKSRFPEVPHIKIYLENTTKLPEIESDCLPGTLEYLRKFIDSNINQNLFGLCIDTEHYYAVHGEFPKVEDYLKYDTIWHINTVPEKVKPCSKIDLHSDTTIFECSKFKTQSYLELADELENHNIPYVREVKEDTMYRELKQMETWSQT